MTSQGQICLVQHSDSYFCKGGMLTFIYMCSDKSIELKLESLLIFFDSLKVCQYSSLFESLLIFFGSMKVCSYFLALRKSTHILGSMKVCSYSLAL